MGRIFQRKQFSDYLGENRAILDIVTNYTQNPICPEQITLIDADPSLGGSIMNRLYDYSGGSLTSVYCNSYNDSVPENYTAWTRNVQIGGYNYPAWGGSGTTFPSYYYYIAWDTQYNGWVYFRMIDSNRPIYSGMTSPLPVQYVGIYTGTTFVGDTAYPILENPIYPLSFNAMWSSPCPSSTPIIPTVTPTPSPTQGGTTPTPTPTPTITPTITNTPTVTPTLTPSPTTPSNLFFVDSGFDTTTECVLNDDSNDTIFVGGIFNFWQGHYSPHIVKINKYGTIDPTFVSGLDPVSTSIRVSCIAQSSEDNEIFIGGDFTSYSGITTQRFTKINKTTGQQISGWDGTNAQNGVTNMVVDGTDVVIIGAFTSYKGTSRARIARITSGNTVDTTIFSGTPLTTSANKIIINNSGNYVLVGAFTTYYGATVNGIVEIDRNTGLNTGLFGSGFNGGVARDITYDPIADIYYVITQAATNTYQGGPAGWLHAIDGSGSLISSSSPFTVSQPPLGIFGDFTNGYLYITWNALNRYSRVDVTTLTQDTTWYNNIGVVNSAIFQPGRIFAALNTDDKVYITGQFTSFFGQNYNRIVRLNQDGTTNSYL